MAAPSRAQTPRDPRDPAIVAVAQAMIASLEAKNFGRARHLCDQLILWEPENPVHHYNLACIEACAGGPRLADAFAALEHSVKLGFADADHVQADPDLRPLHADPRFAELVRRAAANARAAAAIDSIAVPSRMPDAIAAPAPAVLPDGLPHGLYLSTRPAAGTEETEFAAWYFSPDGRVFQNPRAGVETADLSAHRGLKGSIRLAGSSLEITWANNPKVAAPLSLTPRGFEWSGLAFAPAAPFAGPAQLVGSYANVHPLPAQGELAEVPRRFELRPDGTAHWRDLSGGEIEGRWELHQFSLRLIEADGTVLRLLVLPLDAAKTATPPRRILLAGAVFRRS